MNSIRITLQSLSMQYGTGNISVDLFIAGVILLVLFVLLIPVLSRRKEPALIELNDSLEQLRLELQRLEALFKNVESDYFLLKEQLLGEIKFLKNRVDTPGNVPSGSSKGIADTGSRSVPKPPPSVPRAPNVEGTLIRDMPRPPTQEPAPIKEASSGSLASRLLKSRKGIIEKIKGVFGGAPKLKQDQLDDLEVLLVTSDLGVKTVREILSYVREQGAREGITEKDLIFLVKKKLTEILTSGARHSASIVPQKQVDGPLVVLVVGVNGAGKTTTIGKLAHKWSRQGASVLLVAADTFRAAAVDQLKIWGERLQVPVLCGKPDDKPSTVVFDAMIEAKKQGADVVIVDTAGRLHNKSNLMQELQGIRNVISRHQASAPHEVLLVIDGTTGQNALAQAREFQAATQVTGLVITKLDGTSKGGMVVGIKDELDIPVKYVGVGEQMGDLREFNAEEYVEALLEDE